MPTIRLIPSVLYNADAYLTVSDESNAFTNTDSTTFATIESTFDSTASRYVYLRGFNFDAVPNDATVTGFTIKFNAYTQGGKTSKIYAYNGTTQVSAAGSATGLNSSVSARLHTFTDTTIDWETLKGYGSNFGIRFNCGRTYANTKSFVYLYGAEIEVTYTRVGSETIYYKDNGTWVSASSVYKKVNGSWELQNDLSNVFDSQTNYVKGE